MKPRRTGRRWDRWKSCNCSAAVVLSVTAAWVHHSQCASGLRCLQLLLAFHVMVHGSRDHFVLWVMSWVLKRQRELCWVWCWRRHAENDHKRSPAICISVPDALPGACAAMAWDSVSALKLFISLVGETGKYTGNAIAGQWVSHRFCCRVLEATADPPGGPEKGSPELRSKSIKKSARRADTCLQVDILLCVSWNVGQ